MRCISLKVFNERVSSSAVLSDHALMRGEINIVGILFKAKGKLACASRISLFRDFSRAPRSRESMEE
jgi:hypothetical protein